MSTLVVYLPGEGASSGMCTCKDILGVDTSELSMGSVQKLVLELGTRPRTAQLKLIIAFVFAVVIKFDN